MADPIIPTCPDLAPSIPPVVTPHSSAAELDVHTKWWELDNVVQYVLVAHLGSSPRMLLPEESAERTARDIYDTLKSNFGSNRRSEGTNIFLELLNVHCQPHQVRDYVMTCGTVVSWYRDMS
jgi:hypothetical protein